MTDPTVSSTGRRGNSEWGGTRKPSARRPTPKSPSPKTGGPGGRAAEGRSRRRGARLAGVRRPKCALARRFRGSKLMDLSLKTLRGQSHLHRRSAADLPVDLRADWLGRAVAQGLRGELTSTLRRNRVNRECARGALAKRCFQGLKQRSLASRIWTMLSAHPELAVRKMSKDHRVVDIFEA